MYLKNSEQESRFIIKPIKADDREAAKTYIGATVAPVLYLPDHPYSTPYAVWLEKTGRIKRKDISNEKPIRWGLKLERPIAEVWMEDHPGEFGDLEGEENLLVLNGEEFCACHVDFVTIRKADGKPVLIEVKNSEMPMSKWKPVPPDHYVLQCQWEMFITGIEECYLVAKVGNNLVEHLVHADHIIQENMHEAVSRFWHENIEKDVCPPMRWTDADLIRENMGDIDPELSETRDDLIPLVEEYQKIKSNYDDANNYLKAQKEAKDLAEAIILKELINSKAKIVKIGNATITRWLQKTVTIPADKLQEKYPDAYNELAKVSESGRYKITVKEHKGGKK